MEDRENKVTLKPSEVVKNMFDAWDQSAKHKGQRVTVGGVTVRHKGVTQPPEVEVSENIEIKSPKK